MRKLFDVTIGPNRRVVPAANAELATIMGDGNKIRSIFLVVSWFETHRVIGALNTAFNRYKKGSQLNFVHPDATLTIWGEGSRDARPAGRVHPLPASPQELFERLRGDAETFAGDDGRLHAKFNDLKQRRPARAAHIDGLAKEFRDARRRHRSTTIWPLRRRLAKRSDGPHGRGACGTRALHGDANPTN